MSKLDAAYEARLATFWTEFEAAGSSKLAIDKLQYDRNTPDNLPIDLTTTPRKPTTVERVRELRKKLDGGLSYSARTGTGQRFEVDNAPKREDSKLHKSYATYQGKKVELGWSLIR